MQILDLKNIKRTEGVIYYRRQYSADVQLELPNQIENLPITFTIETNPIGMKEFELEIDRYKLNYPLLPIRKALKEFILNKDEQGELPIWYLKQIPQKKLLL